MVIIEAIMDGMFRANEAVLTIMARVYLALAFQIYRLYAFAWRSRSLTYKQIINGTVFGGLSLLLVGAIYVNTINGGPTLKTLLGDLLLFTYIVLCWLTLAHFDSVLRKHDRELQLAMARQY